jgi:transcriptional regulator with XRE-family HTH domain
VQHGTQEAAAQEVHAAGGAHGRAREVELAKALKVSQQTISKKLRGECAISVSDLETLARKFKRHMMWFFQDWKF